MSTTEEQLRDEIKAIHERLHGRQRTHQEVAKHSRWTSVELDNVLREDEWLYEKEMLALLSQHTQRARVEELNLYQEHYGDDYDHYIDDRIVQLSTKDSTNKEDV